MKFANRLKEEKIQEWEQEYMEYKLLKKQLKFLDDNGTASGFYRLLEEQLMKVVTFMRTQQERISEELEDDLLPLAQHGGDSCSGGSRPTVGTLMPKGIYSRPHTNSQMLLRCQMLQTSIDQFRHYVRLNQDGLRKIVKKFDKRFHTSFKDVCPAAATELPFSVREVQAWMLDPTVQLLKLMRERDLGADRPLRQFHFWVEELKVGCQLARVRRFRFDLPLTPLRLQLCNADPEDLRLVVKNTFIASLGEDEDPIEGERKRVLGRRRVYSDRVVDALVSDDDTLDSFGDEAGSWAAQASEQAPGLDDDGARAWASTHEQWVATPVVVLEHAMCNTFGLAPPPRDTTSVARAEAFRAEMLDSMCLEEVDADNEAEWSPVPARSPVRGGPRQSATSSQETHGSAMDALSHCSSLDNQHSGASNHGSSASNHESCASAGGGHSAGGEPGARQRAQRRQPAAARGQQHDVTMAPPAPAGMRAWAGGQGGSTAQSSSRTGRWWTEVSDTCALTGFPVRMLPYPPFKLRARAAEASKCSVVLVDGQYLVLQVLTTWQFEALGRALDISDINSLDKHIQQCKLGPWRLGKALQLFAEGSDKHGELESLRARARRKLETLRHIQRSRLAQGDRPDPAQAGAGRANGHAARQGGPGQASRSGPRGNFGHQQGQQGPQAAAQGRRPGGGSSSSGSSMRPSFS